MMRLKSVQSSNHSGGMQRKHFLGMDKLGEADSHNEPISRLMLILLITWGWGSVCIDWL